MKILHITPHLGGGVGKVILNYVVRTKKQYMHTILCLDYVNAYAESVAKKENILVEGNLSKDHHRILRFVEDADLVLIHWYNHPLLYAFLVREILPPCRVIMWSHISGLHPPNVFVEPLFEYADMFVFSSPISFQAEEIRELSPDKKKRIRVVWSTGGVDQMMMVKKKKRDGFTIGYVGTVEYCKMHRNFLRMASNIITMQEYSKRFPYIDFVVIGRGNEKEIEREAMVKGVRHVRFLGYVDNLIQQLECFDVFGYPLSPDHYGTCDQVLGEAMACGVVPVVLGNPMEEYIVEDGVSGIVAGSEQEYVEALWSLYINRGLLNRLSDGAKARAKDLYDMDTMVKRWDDVFMECMVNRRRKRRWSGKHSGMDTKPSEVFLESIGRYGKVFEEIEMMGCSSLWQSRSKGTMHQYHTFFNEDESLMVWSKMWGVYDGRY